jgi:hypothetical protein
MNDTIYTSREQQLRGMISFHVRAENAYRASGQDKMAERAMEMREQCEAELEELEKGGDQ